ncbi:hypothetical protein ES702_01461 [subsurface metagenome]
MGSRNPYGAEIYRWSSLISQQVARKDPFFQKTALMEIRYKRAYAILYAIEETGLLEMDLSSMTDMEIMTKLLMPLLQRIGQANFKCDVLTNLGFKSALDQQEGEMDIDNIKG